MSRQTVLISSEVNAASVQAARPARPVGGGRTARAATPPYLALMEFFLSERCDSTAWRAVAVLTIVIGCLVTLLLGVPQVAVYGHDVFIMLDGGWRVLQGQRPHVDFYSGFGPLSYLIAAAGLGSARCEVVGIVYMTTAVGLALGLWIWFLVRSRLKAWFAMLFLALGVFFWLAPFPIGEPYYMTSYAMQYNRLGYILLAIILVELYSTQPGQTHAGLSTGIATGFALFLKISFFFPAVVLIAASYVLAGKCRKHFCAVVLGFGLVCLPMLAYLQWDLAAMLGDINIAAMARRLRFFESYDPLRTLLRNINPMFMLVGFAFVTWLCVADMERAGTRSAAKQLFGLSLLVLGVDIMTSIANTQRHGFPLALFAALIFANRISGRFVSDRGRLVPSSLAGPVAVAVAALVIVFPPLSDTVNGWGSVLRSRLSKDAAQHSVHIEAPHLAALAFNDHNEPGTDPADNNGLAYATLVNEGLTLLRSNSGAGDRIACLWFANPFSYALLRAPARGGSTFFDYGTNFTDAHSPGQSAFWEMRWWLFIPKTTGMTTT